MEFLDARRLTGPNVLGNKPGAILDVACTPEEAGWLIPHCKAQIQRMLDAVGWGRETICYQRSSGGVSIAFSAPIDALYAAVTINEWAWACCEQEFSGGPLPDFDTKVTEIKTAIAAESNTLLLALAQAASEHGLSFLWDDEEVSVGSGIGFRAWPFRELPDPDSLDWDAFHDVPVGIVTGTNGKTTTARIVHHILQTAGLNAGLSCTDWVAVNDHIIDRDDWSGPGGARMVLRQKEVDAAILETARGGLLRRGLGISKAQAALITNISEDHLGDFGSRNLQELLSIKWVVSRAVEHSGYLILNADDELLVRKSREFKGKIAWFSLDENNLTVVDHVARGGLAFIYSGGKLVRLEGQARETICVAGDIPITLKGAALHNVANCLGAAALMDCLGVTVSEIRTGLITMSQAANPGRGNLYPVRDFNVLVDFAHNPKAIDALLGMARALPARRRVLCFGQAGDRTDAQIREFSRSAWSMGLDMAIVSELRKYARGRAPGEVYGIIRDELIRSGAREDQIKHFNTETESFIAALDWAAEGDLVVMIDLGRNSNIQKRLTASQKEDLQTKFKACPGCGFKWHSRDDFLNDNNISFVGYQVNFKNLRTGIFLFNHSCKDTLALEVGAFEDLYDGPIYQERATGSDSCPGHCLREDILDPCPAKCECAFVREIIQILRNKGSSPN